jgi:hypothetical protein
LFAAKKYFRQSQNHNFSSRRIESHGNYVYIETTRLILASLDARFVTVDDNELIDGEIGICDLSRFTFKHFLKIAGSLSITKAYSKYVQDAAPVKMIQNHFVNCSPAMSTMFNLLKPFMKKEVLESVKIHTSFETLHESLPKEILPIEYGGTAGSIDDLHDEFVKKIEEKR